MSAIQVRHAKLWFAGKGKNWQLAAYELDELKEAFEDAAKYQPDLKSRPIAKIIEPMTAQPIAQLEKAIESKDSTRFVRGPMTASRSPAWQAIKPPITASFRSRTLPPLTNQRFNLGPQP